MHKAVRRIFVFLSVFIALILVGFALVLGGAAYFNSAPDKDPKPDEDAMRINDDGALLMEIKNGESSDSVGRRLENAGVIRSRYFWFILSRLEKEFIKTGTYQIELPASQIKIRSILTTGEQLLVRVTVPEGVTLSKAALIMEEEGICGAEDFLAAAASREILDAYHVPGKTMEGYLFPDTYLFHRAYPASRVVRVMADNFFSKLQKIVPEASFYFGTEAPHLNQAISPVELNNRIIIASIVEREYRIPEEASIMAGVFYNRLKINMQLQSCATVEYVITEIQGRPHPDILYNRDLEIRDPYNTYVNRGLPPGPICAPGETALRAAFFPSQTQYLFFRLMDPREGRHYFSATLDDHIKAGALYLKGR